jgi:Predicted transcriptional regulators
MFSEKFKELRKSKDLTQEQIAEIFNVAPQSVSRWETGANYPDIELLPHIAIFFGVTVDELLDTESMRNEAKVRDYTRDIRLLLNSGKANDAVELARKAVKDYPLNPDLHYHFVQALSNANADKNEIIAISNRVINLLDYKSSLDHRVQLIRQYAKWGMKDEAKELLDTLPDEMWQSKDPWVGLVLDGEEWRKNQQHRIIRARYLLEYLVSDYIDKADLDIHQKIKFRKSKLLIESLIDEMGYDNPQEAVVHLELVFEYIGIAGLYCEAGDGENAVDYIEKATQESLYHTEQMDKPDADGSNYMAWKTPRNLCWILWEDYLMKPKYDIVRNDERFIKCLEILKSNSRELK